MMSMKQRNRGNESEIKAIIINVFCYAYNIEIKGLGLYNFEPVYLPDGNDEEPNKRRIVDSDKLKKFIKDNFGKLDYNEFIEKMKDNNFIEIIVNLLNIECAKSSYKSDFYRGNLGISVKNYGETNKKLDLKNTDVSIMNRGTFNSFLECANRISKDEELKKLYDEYDVLNDNYEENVSRIYKEFLIAIKQDKFPLHCSNYKNNTKEYGFFYPIEIWKYIKPMIVYFTYKGTYTGNSYNKADCVMEITNPFDINTYKIYYDFNYYVEKHRKSSSFEIRGISKTAVKSYFSRIPEDVLLEMGIIKMKEKKSNKIKFYGMFRTAFKLTKEDRNNR